MRFQDQTEMGFSDAFSGKRFVVAGIFPVLFFILIVSRLFVLQIVRGEAYVQRSKSNFIQERPIRHLRGRIFTSDGIPLVDNRASHDVYLTFALLPNGKQGITRKELFKRLQGLLGLPDDEMAQKIDAAQKKSEGLARFKPAFLHADVGYDSYAKIEAAVALGELPGVAIFDSKQRRYIHGEFAAHALGFLNEVTVNELRTKPEYKSGDRIGRKGVEGVYEGVLRGKDGIMRSVVDARGRLFDESWQNDLLGEERVTNPSAGNDIFLSIDYDLQKVAEDGFSGVAGSVFVVEAKTGFIKALASFPKYDPNLVVGANNNAAIRKLTADPLKPWMNKVTQEHYAPGSTFKPITAVAGLNNGIISLQTPIKCTGNFYIGKAHWRCYERGGHGTIMLFKALRTSCDVFFYRVGYDLGMDKLYDVASEFGFGTRTGIDLGQESPGILPSTTYYKKRLGYYTKGNVVNSSIGQGDVTVTPAGLGMAYVALVNGGKVFKPQIVRKIVSPNGDTVEERVPIVRQVVSNPEDHLGAVRLGLGGILDADSSAGGLRWRADMAEIMKWVREKKPSVGGKTGTAQVVKLSKAIKHLRPEEVTYMQRDHAWFVAFSPVEDPEIVIVSMNEHGGFGSSAAAPVVLKILKKWFEKKEESKNASAR